MRQRTTSLSELRKGDLGMGHDEDGEDEAFDERGLLRDGHSFRVPHRMADSAAFPRPRHRSYATDAGGSTMGLHRPGYRPPAGGHAGDRALLDAMKDEAERERDRYIHDISNAWRHRDQAQSSEADDDAEVEARAGAIRNALLSRGHAPGDVEAYLNDLDDDDVLDGDIGDHVQAFEGRDAKTVAAARRQRLEQIYALRDYELQNAWRKGK
jgi:hypothetical protein